MHKIACFRTSFSILFFEPQLSSKLSSYSSVKKNKVAASSRRQYLTKEEKVTSKQLIADKQVGGALEAFISSPGLEFSYHFEVFIPHCQFSFL